MGNHYPSKQVPLRLLSLSLADISKLYEKLQICVREQGELEISKLVKAPDRSQEDFDADIADIRARAFLVTVTIMGEDGSSLYGDSTSIFSHPNLPHIISTIYLTNNSSYQAIAKNKPINSFEIFLDFSKPTLLDASNIVSGPTPNSSNLKVEGDRDGWVASICEAIASATQYKKMRRSLIHRAYIYDWGVMLLGFPLGFYLCGKIENLISMKFDQSDSFIKSSIYVYIIFLSLWIYRLIFCYARWIFPVMDLKNNNEISNAHRLFFGAILMSILGSAAYDLIKYIS